MSGSFVTPGTVACQAPLSMGFPRQEYWSGLPFPSPGDLSDPGIEPKSPALAGLFYTTEPPGNHRFKINCTIKFFKKKTIIGVIESTSFTSPYPGITIP